MAGDLPILSFKDKNKSSAMRLKKGIKKGTEVPLLNFDTKILFQFLHYSFESSRVVHG